MSSPRPEIADAQVGNAAQPLHLFPETRLGARIQQVELQLAQLLQSCARLQFANLRQRINLPHRCAGPQPLEAQIDLSISNRELVVGEPEIVFQPLEKRRLKNAALSKK